MLSLVRAFGDWMPFARAAAGVIVRLVTFGSSKALRTLAGELRGLWGFSCAVLVLVDLRMSVTSLWGVLVNGARARGLPEAVGLSSGMWAKLWCGSTAGG